ncbi:hypothetical protein V1514DRAFT_337196 [Lipomyces japonicus]|uniref:uncharacterized protein n=1 Tax=Lipomyces japonicus TaxID=56871 RepID=UPI0034CE5CD9
MEENPCIICLQSLPLRFQASDRNVTSASADTLESGTTYVDGDEVYNGTNDIARLIPCKHCLHQSCIKLWIEQANSCPTCRTSFNTIEVLKIVDGDVQFTYHVNDKVQMADLDPQFIEDPEDLELEDQTPCLICDFGGRENELLLCDSCDLPYHASCLGLDGVPPDAWYCFSCIDNHLVPESQSRRQSSRRTAGQRQASSASRTTSRTGGRTRQWGRAWQTVWDRLNQDLAWENTEDPSDDVQNEEDLVELPDGSRFRRTGRRPVSTRSRINRLADERRLWTVRLRIAESTGSASHFRRTAPWLLGSQEDEDGSWHESPDMIASWNMLEEALELNEPSTSTTPINLRRRRVVSSPRVDHDEQESSSRKLKRPRASQRRQDQIAHTEDEPSSHSSSEFNSAGPSLMKSLLQDIRRPSSPTQESSFLLNLNTNAPNGELPTPGPMSPRFFPLPASSPARSPSLSPTLLPSNASLLPSPPAELKHSSILSAATSPALSGVQSPPPQSQFSSPPPSHKASDYQLSLERKTEIQEIVRAVLRPFYRSGDINKDEYTDINKKVSHILYDLVSTNEAQAEHAHDARFKEEWLEIAQKNVQLEMKNVKR